MDWLLLIIALAIVIWFLIIVVRLFVDANEMEKTIKSIPEVNLQLINDALRKLKSKEVFYVTPSEDNLKAALRKLQSESKKVFDERMQQLAEEYGTAAPFKDTYSAWGYCAIAGEDLLFQANYDTKILPGYQKYYLFDKSVSMGDVGTLGNVREEIAPGTVSSIPIKDIKFYAMEGELSYSTRTSGGGVNVKGAVGGGLLFGDAGAIIGSRAGTEIRSETLTHDNRSIIICYVRDGQEHTEDLKSFDPDKTLAALRELLPGKDYKSYSLSILQNSQNTNSNSSNTATQIKELKELLDIGAITEEEFATKKKQILGL